MSDVKYPPITYVFHDAENILHYGVGEQTLYQVDTPASAETALSLILERDMYNSQTPIYKTAIEFFNSQIAPENMRHLTSEAMSMSTLEYRKFIFDSYNSYRGSHLGIIFDFSSQYPVITILDISKDSHIDPVSISPDDLDRRVQHLTETS